MTIQLTGKNGTSNTSNVSINTATDSNIQLAEYFRPSSTRWQPAAASGCSSGRVMPTFPFKESACRSPECPLEICNLT